MDTLVLGVSGCLDWWRSTRLAEEDHFWRKLASPRVVSRDLVSYRFRLVRANSRY